MMSCTYPLCNCVPASEFKSGVPILCQKRESAQRPDPRYLPDQQQVMIDYTSHAGVRAVRRIAPIAWRFGATKWHPEPQWLLDGCDLGKDDVRTFAVKDIHKWSPSLISGVDASIAKQLQRSMELNARTKNRIQLLLSHAGPDMMESFVSGLQRILKDEDPTDGF